MAELSDKKRALLRALLEKEGLQQEHHRIPLRPPGPAPLSFSQERLWYLDRITPGIPAYNIPLAYRLRGPLDPAALAAALNAVVARHEVLRTYFPVPVDRSQPVMAISPDSEVPLPLINLADASPEAIAQHIRAEARQPFDLARGPLLRAVLLQIGPGDHVFLLTLHHIIADGWSLAVLLRELSAAYRARLQGETMVLPDLPVQYADFAVWQRERMRTGELQPQIDYWREQLSGEITPLELPADRPRPTVQTFNGRWFEHTLQAETAAAVKHLAKKSGSPLLSFVLAAFNTLLHRYTGETDILVGSPVTHRTRTELEGLIGHFVNTQVLRTDVSGRPTYRELVERVRQTVLDAFANQDVPFEKLLDLLETGRDPGKNPLFQVVFILQDAPAHANWRTALQLEGIEVVPVFTHSDTAKFDLAVEVEDLPQGLTVSFEYSTDLFDEATIRRMAGHFETLLAAAVANPDTPIADLPLLTAAEIEEIVRWNRTRTDYPRHATIHELFEAQAVQRPEAVALVFEDRQITYGELNRRADQLAAALRRKGVGPDERVCIACERSFDLIIGILGILKAGGAFVPLDMNYPAKRIAFMLADSRAKIVLVQEKLREAFNEQTIGDARLLNLDDFSVRTVQGLPRAPRVAVTADHIAYVMYTSGSTGTPKGAAIPHRAVVRLVKETNFITLGPEEVFFQISPVSFDASTLEIWGALLNGGRLVIPPPGQLAFQEIGDRILEEGVTTLWLTAGLFHEMVEQVPQGLARVRQLFTGGDVVSPAHVRTMLGHLESGRILNGYGPTENTTFTTTYPMESPQDVGTAIPIGRPIANTTAYILDTSLRPVPVGVVGELYTGGDGLARGYLDRPALTAERFLPDPFAGGGRRMYRTGDLARWRADGAIEFLGRRDFQVKLRGFRIELGEIEAALGKLPGVRGCAVVARRGVDGGDKRLVGYVIAENGVDLTAGELREQLSAALPDYMVPAVFVFLDAFPLTENGKLDRRALPEPPSERPEVGTAFEAPQNETEQRIAAIWREVLELDAVGLDDNFFDLGGHSLLMLQVHSKLKAAFDQELPMIEMFSYPTVRSMAVRLAGGEAEKEDLRARGEARRRRMQRRKR